MDNLQFIQNEIICQFACNLEPECDYFVYDKEQQNCELIHGQKVECDLMIGPPDPLIRSCKNFTEIQNFTEITTRYEQCSRIFLKSHELFFHTFWRTVLTQCASKRDHLRNMKIANFQNLFREVWGCW